jgi:diguanylate cyclase (GGDEF)-like protein
VAAVTVAVGAGVDAVGVSAGTGGASGASVGVVVGAGADATVAVGAVATGVVTDGEGVGAAGVTPLSPTIRIARGAAGAVLAGAPLDAPTIRTAAVWSEPTMWTALATGAMAAVVAGFVVAACVRAGVWWAGSGAASTGAGRVVIGALIALSPPGSGPSRRPGRSSRPATTTANDAPVAACVHESLMLSFRRADNDCGKGIGRSRGFLSRLGSFKLKLFVWFALLALLPLAVAFYGYDTLARRSETRGADASLEAGLRAAVAAYSSRVDAAGASARRLAAEPAVQHALRAHDRKALARLVPQPAVQPAAVQTVSVLSAGKLLGRISVSVRVDDSLLDRIATALTPEDRLVAVQQGRIVAGPGTGTPLTLATGVSTRVEVDGVAYRALRTAALGSPRGLSFAALAPQATIDDATGASDRRIAAALAASLVLFALATYLLGRSVVGTLGRLARAADAIAGGDLEERVEVRGQDEFAQLGRAFNRMAGELEQRLTELEQERSRVRQAVARFGEALAATHEPNQLLRVVVESAVEATGATGGVVLGRDGELARAGDPDAGSEKIELPLQVGSSDFGLLVLHGSHFDPAHIEAATSLAAQVVVALENARLHEVVEQQALVDGLTGLANRRSLEQFLHAELAHAARFGEPAAFVLADVDDFKQVNDRYGHAVGDDVLREFATALRETVRDSDVAARWGGEEFALVLTGTDIGGGVRLAERARQAVASRAIRLPDGGELAVTASFGVAAFPYRRGADALLAAADEALYAAKRNGKNRVVGARESTPEEIV